MLPGRAKSARQVRAANMEIAAVAVAVAAAVTAAAVVAVVTNRNHNFSDGVRAVGLHYFTI